MQVDWFLKKRVFMSLALGSAPDRRGAVELMRHLEERYVGPMARLPADEARIAWKSPGLTRPHDRQVSLRNWDACRDDPTLLQWIAVSTVRSFPGEWPSWGQLAGAALRAPDDSLSDPIVLEIDLEMEELGDRLTEEWQEEFVDWGCNVFSAYGGLSGYITVDAIGASVYPRQSPYEVAVQARCPRLREEFEAALRGCYWGNLLGPALIGRLGGVAEILSALSGEVRSLGSASYFVRATGKPLNGFEASDIHRLRNYFERILPKGARRFESYSGPPAYVL